MNSATIFTAGHSDRAIDELLALLRAADVRCVVDVRAVPHSTRHPHFDQEPLRISLEAEGRVYHWAGRSLGGRRVALADSLHVGLHDPAARGFADHMRSDEFKRGFAQLCHVARAAPTVILCAERLPEHCHRRLIADALLLEGWLVTHLINAGESRDHILSPEARRESAALIYDRFADGRLSF